MTTPAPSSQPPPGQQPLPSAQPPPGMHVQPPAEEGIPPTEDLMREHGVLNRLLLIYETGIDRIRSHQPIPPDTLQDAAHLIRVFIQDYHEHLEEQWIFPLFEKSGQLVDLVETLRLQHARGRDLTDLISYVAQPQQFRYPENRRKYVWAAEWFLRMYRPHEAREDTVLFPAVRSLTTPHEFDAMGEMFEAEEQRRFGEHGFERVVAAVADIEKRLGIYDLAQFTPPPVPGRGSVPPTPKPPLPNRQNDRKLGAPVTLRVNLPAMCLDEPLGDS